MSYLLQTIQEEGRQDAGKTAVSLDPHKTLVRQAWCNPLLETGKLRPERPGALPNVKWEKGRQWN